MTNRQEEALQSLRKREERYKRAINGDSDALMECMYEAGMFSKEALDDYYKIKERYGDQQDEQ